MAFDLNTPAAEEGEKVPDLNKSPAEHEEDHDSLEGVVAAVEVWGAHHFDLHPVQNEQIYQGKHSTLSLVLSLSLSLSPSLSPPPLLSLSLVVSLSRSLSLYLSPLLSLSGSLSLQFSLSPLLSLSCSFVSSLSVLK